MKCKQCNAPVPFQSSPVPAWMNPTATIATGAIKVTPFPLVGNTVTFAVKANPLRVAVGFSFGTGATQALAAPHSAPDKGGWVISNNVTSSWFTTFTHGPMVGMEWYLYAAAIVTVYIYEWYRLP